MKRALGCRTAWVLGLVASLAPVSCGDDGGGGSSDDDDMGGTAGRVNGAGGNGVNGGSAGMMNGIGGRTPMGGNGGQDGAEAGAESGGSAASGASGEGEGGSSAGAAGTAGVSGEAGSGGTSGTPGTNEEIGGGAGTGSGVFRVTKDQASERIVGVVRLGDDYAVVYNKTYIENPSLVSYDTLAFARVHGSDGKAKGPELTLAERASEDEVYLATGTCTRADGGFLVGLRQGILKPPTTAGARIAEYATTLLQAFDAEGELLQEWTVPGASSVACLPDGRWAVAWVTGNSTGMDTVHAQVEGESAFVVDTATTNERNQGFGQSSSPFVAPSGADAIAVAWQTRTADGETLQGGDLFVGSFADDGEVIVPEHKINTTESLSGVGSIWLELLADGSYVVTWAFLTQGYTRVLGADLAPASAELHIETAGSTSSQLFGASAAPDGYYLSASLAGGDARGAVLLPFDSSGSAQGSPVWLESAGVINYYRPRSIVALGDGRVATAFTFTEGDPNDLSAQWDIATEVVTVP